MGRVFKLPMKTRWWHWLLRVPLRYELIEFSHLTLKDIPTQYPFETLPKTLKDPIRRHQWRVVHGYSYVTPMLQGIIEDNRI